MKLFRLSLVVLLISAVIVSCDDDDDVTAPTVDQLAGMWIASNDSTGTQFTLTWNQDPGQTFSPFTAGAIVTVTIVEDGSFSILLDFPDVQGAPPDVLIPGTFELSGSQVTVTTALGVVSGNISLSNEDTRLTMNLEDVSLFDFDGDDVSPGDPDDDALLEAVMARFEP